MASDLDNAVVEEISSSDEQSLHNLAVGIIRDRAGDTVKRTPFAQNPWSIQSHSDVRDTQGSTNPYISGTAIPAYCIAAKQDPRLGDDLEDLALALAEADKAVINFNLGYLD